MDSSDINYMDIKEFRTEGYLQEVNRLYLHPLGLALEVQVDEEGNESLGRVWDYRDDPEGINYAGMDGEEMMRKAQNVRQQWKNRQKPRQDAVGYMVQPIFTAEESE